MLEIVTERESKMTPNANSQGSKSRFKSQKVNPEKAIFEGVYRHRGNLGFPLRYDSMTMDQRIMNKRRERERE